MAQFIRIKSKDYHNYVAVDAIRAWHVEERHKQNPDGELVLKIDDGDPECYFVGELGYYSVKDAEAAVIHAIEMPGTVGVVPYRDKSQSQKNDAAIYDNGKFACIDITVISREECE